LVGDAQAIRQGPAAEILKALEGAFGNQVNTTGQAIGALTNAINNALTGATTQTTSPPTTVIDLRPQPTGGIGASCIGNVCSCPLGFVQQGNACICPPGQVISGQSCVPGSGA